MNIKLINISTLHYVYANMYAIFNRRVVFVVYHSTVTDHVNYNYFQIKTVPTGVQRAKEL